MSTFKCNFCSKSKSTQDFFFNENKEIYSTCIECTELIPTIPSFLDGFPDLKRTWDYKTNNRNGLFPHKLSKTNKYLVSWLCEVENHPDWVAKIYSRTRTDSYNTICPECKKERPLKPCNYSTKTLFEAYPHLRDEWDYEKNKGINPEHLLPGSNKKVWWKCKNGHSFDARIFHRTKDGLNCRFCSNREVSEENSLYYSHPHLRDEWIEEKNGDMKKFAPSSNKVKWWRCVKNKTHTWPTKINHRTGVSKTGCPCCLNMRLATDKSNSVYYTHPYLREEWIEEKNGDMKNFVSGTLTSVWWKCKNNPEHIWKTRISHRTYSKKSTACPWCQTSGLEREAERAFQDLEIEYKKGVSFKDCKGLKKHPQYDFYLPILKTRVEMQGVQHYLMGPFHHNNIEEFLIRINMDNNKSFSTYKAGENFLSIARPCLGQIKEIVTEYMYELENCEQLCRYYITPNSYISFDGESILPKMEEFNDPEILSIFQWAMLYRYDILKDKLSIIKTKDIEKCEKCDGIYRKMFMKFHKACEAEEESLIKEPLNEE